MERTKIYKISLIGVFGALVFVSNFLSIPIPIAIGDVSRIHLGNAFCLLSGLVLGPVGGGLSAGIGSALYDLTNPVYITSAPFTFVFKFLLAMLPGFIANSKKTGVKLLVTRISFSAMGQVVYIVLYLSKSYISGILEGSAAQALLPAMITRLGTSVVNAVIAIIIAVPLCMMVRAALVKSGLLKKPQNLSQEKTT